MILVIDVDINYNPVWYYYCPQMETQKVRPATMEEWLIKPEGVNPKLRIINK